MAPRGDSTDQRASALLRGRDLRVTTPRLQVLGALLDSPSPLDAAALCQRLTSADRVTVYRTLNTLVDAGILHRVDPGDRVFRFGLSEGSPAPAAPGHQHPHFVCDACGTVQCLDDAEVILKPRPRSSRTPGGHTRPAPRPLRVTQKDVLLHGTCGDCGPDPALSAPLPRKRRRAPRA
jgi:Fur family transcriptional regulator, ferric uptake regulator